VTAVGAVTSEGLTAREFWEGVRSCRVAIRPVERLPMEGYRTRLAGEVREEVVPQHDYRHPANFRDRVVDYALKAAEEAVEHGGISFDRVPPERWGVVMGTCNAGLLSGEEWYLAEMKGEAADPQLILLVPPQALAEAISGAFHLKGPVLSIDTACAAGANAIGCGADLIRCGHADVVLAGGSDALSDVLISGFQLPGIALAGAGRALLEGPAGALPRRGKRDAGADAGGPGA
jgi:3-oxoacyl-[acyl-carrier-protein] synthase II